MRAEPSAEPQVDFSIPVSDPPPTNEIDGDPAPRAPRGDRMRALALGLILLCPLAGCGTDAGNGDGPTSGDGMLPGGDGGGGGKDLAVPDGGSGGDLAGLGDSGMSCGATGMPCNVSAGCCSGYCDPNSKTCAFPPNVCGAQGAACKVATDCCNLICTNGTCGAACQPTGKNCNGDGDCCTQHCANGMCAPIVMGGCGTLGNQCKGNGDCCSNNCQGGLCALAGGGCNVIGDICLSGADCCSGVCTIPNGLKAGTCQSNNGGCVQDGEVCPGCSQCCSRVCAKTMTGGNVCQPAGGCRLLGDLCHVDADCCGGPQQGQTMCSVGEVTCVPVQGSMPPVGTCSQPGPGTGGCGTCNPEGDVCGIKPVQACSGNAREDCCDCLPPKFNCCKFDVHGVARCFGGSTPMCPNGYTGMPPCCIQAGDVCTFSDECCDHNPCVPDKNGVLRCGGMCEMQGQTCTSDADCCIGLHCIIPKGMLVGTCDNPMQPPPDGGAPGDGGVVPDSGVKPDAGPGPCSQLGQSCSTIQPCCNQLNCTGPGGITPCAQGEKDCTCTGIIG
jgi:hypothetical protein